MCRIASDGNLARRRGREGRGGNLFKVNRQSVESGCGGVCQFDADCHANGAGVTLKGVQRRGGMGAVFQTAQVGLGDARDLGKIGEAQTAPLAAAFQRIDDVSDPLVAIEYLTGLSANRSGILSVNPASQGFEGLDSSGTEFFFERRTAGIGPSLCYRQ